MSEWCMAHPWMTLVICLSVCLAVIETSSNIAAAMRRKP